MYGLAILATSTMGAATVPVAWQVDFINRPGSKMARDASGFLYVASNQTLATGTVVYLDKFAPNGTKVWASAAMVNSAYVKPELRALVVDNTYAYLVFNERTPGTPFTVLRSKFTAYALSSGTVVTNKVSAEGTEYTSVASNGTQFAILSEDNAGIGKVEFFNRSNWAAAGTANLGNVASTGELRMDPSGFAYSAANNTSGTVQIAKTSAAGGMAFQTTLNSAPRTNGNLQRIELDTANSRVYGLAQFDWSPTDKDVVLFSVNSASGAQTTFVVGGSTTDDNVGNLTPVSDGVIVSTSVPATTSTVAMKRNINGAAVWARAISDTPVPGTRQHGFDVDGNLAVLSNTPFGNFILDKLNAASGAIIERYELYSGANGQFATDLRMDSAGDFYILSASGGGTSLQRIQIAQLTVDTSILQGGASTLCWLQRYNSAPITETWSLASSNTAVATVPSEVTISVGQGSNSFTITALPVSSISTTSITARRNGFVCQQTITVLPAVVNSLAISPQVVKGGTPSTGTVTLTGQATAGGVTVNLGSNKVAAATVPATVVVPAGASQATFPITTFGVNVNQGVVITATTGAVSKTAFFAVNAPALQSISVNPGSLQGGATAQLTLTLDGIAPVGGFSVVLFSGAPGIVPLPVSTSVDATQTSKVIDVTPSMVTSSIAVTLIATRSGIYKTTTLTVNP